MRKIYFLLFPLISLGQTQIGVDVLGESSYDLSGDALSISSDGTTIALGASGNDGNGSNSGHVRVYRNVLGVWTQIGADIDGSVSAMKFGADVDLSSDGNIVAVSSHEYNNSKGIVSVYQNVSGVWTQIGSNILGPVFYGSFGFSIDLSSDGSVLAVSAPGSGAGVVRVFRNVSGVWNQIGTDILGEAVQGVDFGYKISLSSDGSVLAVSDPLNSGNGTNSGHVRVFRNVSGVWTQIGVDIDGLATNNYFGSGIALSPDGDVLAVGAPYNINNGSDRGKVKVFRNVSGSWVQVGADINGSVLSGQLGWDLSLSFDGNILSAGMSSGSAGRVSIYRNLSGTWAQIGDVDGNISGDKGYFVGLSSDGSKLVVGAPGYDGPSHADRGRVRVYDLSSILASDNFILKNFSIYPNPASENVSIVLENNLQLERVNIYNSLGQLIRTENKNIIDVVSLESGSYYFEIITNQGKATKVILVK
jgi:Flp pilus assembly pilin Flp